jgi:hypothetical protein
VLELNHHSQDTQRIGLWNDQLCGGRMKKRVTPIKGKRVTQLLCVSG